MNSRVLAAAVAFVFAVPLSVLAESGNVQIYGTINADYERVQANGATAAGALASGQLGATPTGVNVPSRLKAFFQVESAVGFDNQATFGTKTF